MRSGADRVYWQGDVEELREATDAIEGLGLTEIVDHYEALIKTLDDEPS
jgi:hypothetical protein